LALDNYRNHLNIRDRLTAIEEKIVVSLSAFNLHQDYRQLLEKALYSKDSQSQDIADNSKIWGLLPGLCCQAAGGEVSWADTIAASWILFYTAADLMDSAQDQDEPDEWWKEGGSAVALSAATGLFFCASALLGDVAFSERTAGVAQELIRDFHQSFLRMSSGQYSDLIRPHPNLTEYWEIASEKSGSFFSLACRSGARLAGRNSEQIDAFGDFGHSLGVLIQILDDLEDLNSLLHIENVHQIKSLSRSLPFIFAMQVLPEGQLDQLLSFLKFSEKDPQAALSTFEMIEKSGAVIYLLTEIEHYRFSALQKLSLAASDISAREVLETFVRQLGSINNP
jgi:geranylgeranyl pyrophosphate synthase